MSCLDVSDLSSGNPSPKNEGKNGRGSVTEMGLGENNYTNNGQSFVDGEHPSMLHEYR